LAILYSGLRGALAFALSLKTSGLGLPHSDLIISATLAIAMFTTLFQGTTTRPLLRCLKISATSGDKDEELETKSSINSPKKGGKDVSLAERPLLDSDRSDDDETGRGSYNDGSKHRTRFHGLDKRFLSPFFLANPEIAGGGTKQAFTELAKGLTRLTYQQKTNLDSHKKQLWDLLLKFSAQDQQDSKRKLQAEYDQKAKLKEEEEKIKRDKDTEAQDSQHSEFYHPPENLETLGNEKRSFNKNVTSYESNNQSNFSF